MIALVVLASVAVIPAAATLLRAGTTGLDSGLVRRSLVTLVLNVVGSAVLGYLVGNDMSQATFFVGVLGLGALTTFSTFVALVVEWAEARRPFVAVAYVAATLAVSVLAADVAYRW